MKLSGDRKEIFFILRYELLRLCVLWVLMMFFPVDSHMKLWSKWMRMKIVFWKEHNKKTSEKNPKSRAILKREKNLNTVTWREWSLFSPTLFLGKHIGMNEMRNKSNDNLNQLISHHEATKLLRKRSFRQFCMFCSCSSVHDLRHRRACSKYIMSNNNLLLFACFFVKHFRECNTFFVPFNFLPNWIKNTFLVGWRKKKCGRWNRLQNCCCNRSRLFKRTESQRGSDCRIKHVSLNCCKTISRVQSNVTYAHQMARCPIAGIVVVSLSLFRFCSFVLFSYSQTECFFMAFSWFLDVLPGQAVNTKSLLKFEYEPYTQTHTDTHTCKRCARVTFMSPLVEWVHWTNWFFHLSFSFMCARFLLHKFFSFHRSSVCSDPICIRKIGIWKYLIE